MAAARSSAGSVSAPAPAAAIAAMAAASEVLRRATRAVQMAMARVHPYNSMGVRVKGLRIQSVGSQGLGFRD